MSVTQKPKSNHTTFASDRTECLCPCVPATLEGPISMENSKNLTTVTQAMQGVTGGRWSPTSCEARHRIAIIIPYRDRESHLRVLLGVLHPMLQRQQLDYTIYVAEQIRPANIFNKAMLMNSAFVEAKKRREYNCFIFHDVDMIPMDDRNMYTCSDTPRHVGAYADKYRFRLKYRYQFGGALAFQERHFELVNGFSNSFYGWGGEDDDMYRRVKFRRLVIHRRFPPCVGKYRMIRHGRDKTNPPYKKRELGWRFLPATYRKDGLNSLKYTLLDTEEHDMYTRMMFELPEPPSYISSTTHKRRYTNSTAILPATAK